MTQQLKRGKLVIAGAGPGDPEFITVKAARYLREADVILTDRLVGDEILNTYTNSDTEIIFVGKQCRRGISTPQQTINELIVYYCLSGKLVVRLKGGDVSVFSNILDELETVVANNIPYEIIPGVTAALGAAATAGIPLTARGYATSVRFLTYYKSDIVTDEYWKELANTNDTLVFYMSSAKLNEVVEKLTSNNIHEDKLLAVVEQATTPFQNVHIVNLYDYKNKLKSLKFVSPSLVIIGKVVSLHEQFAWLNNNNSRQFYFKPMTSHAIKIINPENLQKNVS